MIRAGFPRPCCDAGELPRRRGRQGRAPPRGRRPSADHRDRGPAGPDEPALRDAGRFDPGGSRSQGGAEADPGVAPRRRSPSLRPRRPGPPAENWLPPRPSDADPACASGHGRARLSAAVRLESPSGRVPGRDEVPRRLRAGRAPRAAMPRLPRPSVAPTTARAGTGAVVTCGVAAAVAAAGGVAAVAARTRSAPVWTRVAAACNTGADDASDTVRTPAGADMDAEEAAGCDMWGCAGFATGSSAPEIGEVESGDGADALFPSAAGAGTRVDRAPREAGVAAATTSVGTGVAAARSDEQAPSLRDGGLDQAEARPRLPEAGPRLPPAPSSAAHRPARACRSRPSRGPASRAAGTPPR